MSTAAGAARVTRTASVSAVNAPEALLAVTLQVISRPSSAACVTSGFGLAGDLRAVESHCSAICGAGWPPQDPATISSVSPIRPPPVQHRGRRSTGANASGSAAILSRSDCSAPPSAGCAVTVTVKPVPSASGAIPISPVAGSMLTPSPATLNLSAEPRKKDDTFKDVNSCFGT